MNDTTYLSTRVAPDAELLHPSAAVPNDVIPACFSTPPTLTNDGPPESPWQKPLVASPTKMVSNPAPANDTEAVYLSPASSVSGLTPQPTSRSLVVGVDTVSSWTSSSWTGSAGASAAMWIT